MINHRHGSLYTRISHENSCILNLNFIRNTCSDTYTQICECSLRVRQERRSFLEHQCSSLLKFVSLNGFLSLFFVLSILTFLTWCLKNVMIKSQIFHVNIIITYEQGLTRGVSHWPSSSGRSRPGRRCQAEPIERIHAWARFWVKSCWRIVRIIRITSLQVR